MISLLAGFWLAVAISIQPGADTPDFSPAPQTSVRAWQVDVELQSLGLDSTPSDEIPPRRGSFVLRLSDDLFRLELGPVVVLGRRDVSSCSLLAWHEHDPATAFIDQADSLELLIRRDLPPIWCGPLADWLAESADAYPLVAYEWPTSLQPDRSQPHQVVLASGSVRDARSFDPESRAPLSERIELRREAGTEVMNLTFTPIAPGDPAGWTIEAGARQRVSSIAALRPQPARIAVGSSVVSLRLFDLQGQPFEWRSAFASEPSAASERQPNVMVLGFFVLSPREGHPDEVMQPQTAVALLNDIRARVAAVAARRQTPRPLFLARPVAIFDVPDFDRDLIDRMAQAAASLQHDPLLPEVEASISDSLWAQPPRETIDLVSPGAQNAIVIVDSARRLVSTVRVTDDIQAVVEAVTRVVLADSPEPASTP